VRESFILSRREAFCFQSTIKRKKGALDAKRSKIFSKLIKEITVAVKEGGPDPDGNPRLRMAIANAKGQSMPKDNIERAISKGKDKNSANFTEVVYEGYLPHGIAIYFGSLSYLFERKGVFVIPKDNLDEDEFEMELIDAGAEDIELEDGFFNVTTSMEDFGNMIIIWK